MSILEIWLFRGIESFVFGDVRNSFFFDGVGMSGLMMIVVRVPCCGISCLHSAKDLQSVSSLSSCFMRN